MADIRLRIEVNPDAETETLGTITNKVNDVGTNSNLSNVSFKASFSGEYADRTATNENGREMLSWANNGILQFNSDGLLSTDGVVAGALASETDPDMFVWGAVPESKQYSVKLTFSKATSLKDIVVYGDKTANQFPTKAIVDGTKTIYSDDYQWAINMETESDTHTIEFVEWNRANYNACLTRIMVMLRYFDLDKGWIDSVESLTQSTSDPSSIQYGVLANSGSATIRDLNGELEDYVKDGIIPESNLSIQLLVNDNIIQNHITTNSEYDIQDKTLHVDLSNNIDRLNSSVFSGLSLNTSTITLLELLKTILEKLNISIQDVEINSYVEERLSKIQIKYAYLENSNCKKALDKICQLGQILMFKTDDDKWAIADARPVYDDTSVIVKIPPHLMVKTPNSDLFLKNKYTKTEIEYSNVSYGYHDLATRSFRNYEDPSFSKLRDTETGEVFNQVAYTNVNSFVDKHDTGSEISYIAWDIPYKTIYTSDSNLRWACFKFSIEKKTAILSKDDTSFVFSFSGDSLSSVLVNDVRYLIKDTESWDNLPISIMENENSVKNHWFNLDSSGDIVSVKQSKYNDGCVVESENNYTFYILQTIMSIYNNAVEYLPYYNGQVTIKMKELISETVTATQGDGDKLFSLTTNETFNNYATYGDDGLAKAISDNVLRDYRDGKKTCTIKIFCGDMFDTNGSKVLDWNKGEIVKVGALVRLDKDSNGTSFYSHADGSPVIFRVTGRTFGYSGSPILSLELQEVGSLSRSVYFPSSTSDLDISVYNSKGDKIEAGDTVLEGSEVKIVISASDIVLGISSVKINGEECKKESDNSWVATIQEDATISIIYDKVQTFEMAVPYPPDVIVYNVNNYEIVAYEGWKVRVDCIAGVYSLAEVSSTPVEFTIETSGGYETQSLTATITTNTLTIVEKENISVIGISYNARIQIEI